MVHPTAGDLVKLVIENIEIPEYLVNTYLDLNKNGFNFNYDIGHDYTSTRALEELIENNNFLIHLYLSTANVISPFSW